MENENKLITLKQLKHYHQDLLDKLRLTNGDATYKYSGSKEFTEDITTIGDMLDFLYDRLLENHLIDGLVNITKHPQSMSAETTESGSYYDLNLQRASNTEVQGLFKDCDCDPDDPDDPEPEPEGDPEWIER